MTDFYPVKENLPIIKLGRSLRDNSLWVRQSKILGYAQTIFGLNATQPKYQFYRREIFDYEHPSQNMKFDFVLIDLLKYFNKTIEPDFVIFFLKRSILDFKKLEKFALF